VDSFSKKLARLDKHQGQSGE